MSDKPRRSYLLPKVVATLVVLGAVALFIVLYSRPTARIETVVSGTAVDAKPGAVTVKEEYSMQMKSQIGGRMLSKNYKLDPGMHVKEGDILAQLDTGDVEIEIEGIRNQLESDKQRIAAGSAATFELESAQSDFNNTERLFKMGQVSESDYNKARRTVETIKQKLAIEKVLNQQNLQTDDNLLKTKERARDKMTITAPFEGEVSDVLAHPGDLVSEGSPIVSLITTTRIVQAKISEEDFANVKVGENALVIFLPYGDWEYHATVTKILPTADPETQRHLADLNVTDIEPAKLIPGITGEVSIVVGSHPAKAIIPRRALLNQNVYVVKDGKVEVRKVKTGFLWLTGAEVTEGLEPGEQVIVEDLETFSPGDRVRVEEIPSDAFGKKK